MSYGGGKGKGKGKRDRALKLLDGSSVRRFRFVGSSRSRTCSPVLSERFARRFVTPKHRIEENLKKTTLRLSKDTTPTEGRLLNQQADAAVHALAGA